MQGHVFSLSLILNVNLTLISPSFCFVLFFLLFFFSLFGTTGYAHMGSYGERLHLWQVFFSCPHEWWDNRNQKSNPKRPDFRHKSTGEALWLHATDPPWIRKQLELLDNKMEEKDQDGHFGSDSSMSKWLYS